MSYNCEHVHCNGLLNKCFRWYLFMSELRTWFFYDCITWNRCSVDGCFWFLQKLCLKRIFHRFWFLIYSIKSTEFSQPIKICIIIFIFVLHEFNRYLTLYMYVQFTSPQNHYDLLLVEECLFDVEKLKENCCSLLLCWFWTVNSEHRTVVQQNAIIRENFNMDVTCKQRATTLFVQKHRLNKYKL